MTKWTLILLISFYGTKTEAQSSQVKLYLQQIAANKVLIGYIQKGYKIARTSLTTINNIKNGEFSLHRELFASLKKINPRIKKLAIVADIISLEAKIVQDYRVIYNHLKESKQFTQREIEYIYSVFTRLLNDTAFTLDELLTLITADEYQMSDDERLMRLNKLHRDMSDNYVFAQQFGDHTMLLAAQRQKEKQEVETSRSLFEFEPNH